MRVPAPPAVAGPASLRAWPPLLATIGAGAATSMHAHHAMHLVLARTGTLSLRDASGRCGRRRAC